MIFSATMKVICLKKKAFYTLLDSVFEHIDSRMEQKVATRWINREEVMKILNIKATSTLQKLRDEGKIRFSRPSKKIILYDRDSIMKYIERYAIEPF